MCRRPYGRENGESRLNLFAVLPLQKPDALPEVLEARILVNGRSTGGAISVRANAAPCERCLTAREPVQTDALDAITVFVNEDDVVLAYFAHAAAAGDRHPPLRATRGIEHYVLGG